MTTREVWTKWLPCGTWRGVLSEQRITPTPRFEDDYEDDDGYDFGDWRGIVLVIGGRDWLADLIAKIPTTSAAIEIRAVLAVDGTPAGGWRLAGRYDRANLLTRYGALRVDGSDVVAAVAQHVASNVTLTIEGRRLLTLPVNEVVTLAHPWHGRTPGARLSVGPGDAAALRRSGYVVGHPGG